MKLHECVMEDLRADHQLLLMQRQLVIDSLQEGVVSLIRDLNGNHVIQRCLQRLGPEDSQFVYDAACAHTMEIATHRHGCCVLQRCIDFATPVQKKLLVAEIAANALPLSQVYPLLGLFSQSEVSSPQFVTDACKLGVNQSSIEQASHAKLLPVMCVLLLLLASAIDTTVHDIMTMTLCCAVEQLNCAQWLHQSYAHAGSLWQLCSPVCVRAGACGSHSHHHAPAVWPVPGVSTAEVLLQCG